MKAYLIEVDMEDDRGKEVGGYKIIVPDGCARIERVFRKRYARHLCSVRKWKVEVITMTEYIRMVSWSN